MGDKSEADQRGTDMAEKTPLSSSKVAEGTKATGAEEKVLSKEERRKLFQQQHGHKIQKKKKLSKKERRALQEEQRKQKADKSKGVQGGKKVTKKPAVNNKGISLQKKAKEQIIKRTTTQKMVPMFGHLPQFERESSLSLNTGFSEEDAKKVHPSILALGLKYGDNVISGANARAASMLLAFKDFIRDYHTPPGKALSRDLDRALKQQIQFLIDCRPHSTTMGNAIKHVRRAILKIPPEMSENDAKAQLYGVIENFISSSITMAQEEIIHYAKMKINDGDVILTYGRSHVVEKLLLEAHSDGIKFKVVVVCARPKEDESKELVKTLASNGVECVFILLTSISYMMGKVTKVFMGASALFSNGAVLSRSGTAVVAMVAHELKKPVLICAETYKFTDRVQLDAITNNELGDPDDLILPTSWVLGKMERSCLSDWRDIPSMKLLNLVYDLTSIDHVTMIITEVGMIPATSVPVIVREKSELEIF
mmetsp:Transcript_10881/g.14182  ORF Transcript_10881/g.14182 Transcript_10881/m.14182 type:complete len:481 (+) Transcript_10881:253-1695(+)